MQALSDIAPDVAIGAAALALVLLVLVVLLWTSVRKVRRAQLVVMGRHEQRDIVAEVMSLDSQVRNLRDAVEILTDQLDRHKEHLDHALTNRAVVRYDAFRDAGGEQSASFALLDNYRSGVVFSAIAARDFARIYVKHLDHGASDRELSPEEVQAVAAAVPKPLGAGEEGARSARAPRSSPPHAPAPAAGEPQTAAGEPAPDESAPAGPGHPGPAPEPESARRAFDALGDLDDGPDEFTWEGGVGSRAPRDPGPPGPGAPGTG